MTIDASIVFHYLYGYQKMRLASQEEIQLYQSSALSKEADKYAEEMRGEKESKYARRKQEEIVMKRKIKPPDGIALCISSIPGARFGACSLKNIPVGTWFGPFEGKLVRPNESICGANSEFMWEIFHDGEVSHFLDGHIQNTWMSFVKCARHKKEQNMVVFQYHGCIYYRTVHEIVPGSELLVWYDAKYTQLLGLPLTWNDGKCSAGKRKVSNNLHGENGRKKRLVDNRSQETKLLPKEKFLITQAVAFQKRAEMQGKEIDSETKCKYAAETKNVPLANGRSRRHDALDKDGMNVQRRGVPSYVPLRPRPVPSFADERELSESKARQETWLDAWREHSVDHWHEKERQAEHHWELNSKYSLECKNGLKGTSPHLTPLVHRRQHYYQYHATKHDESSRLRNVNSSCLPAI